MGEVQDEPTVRKYEGVKRSLDRGVYLPPAKRRLLERHQEELVAEDPYSVEAQRKSWDDERKVIHGTINRLNDKTIKPLLHDLFDKVNLVRMRGVLAKALLRATLVSAQRYGAVYAAALSVLHSKLPEVGDLVVQRAILHFRKSYQRKDKPGCIAICLFLGHLFHQSVVHELLILQILSLLLQGDPTDDSVEIAVRLLRLTGYALQQESPAGVRAVLEQLRGLIHQGRLHPKVQQEAEDLLEERRKGFTPQISPELDLVEQDDQICLEISLDDENLQEEDSLDRFRPDENYQQTLQEWQAIRAEVLGLGDDDEDSTSGSDAETDDDSDDDEQDVEVEPAVGDGTVVVAPDKKAELVVVQDMTEADLIHLRRTIYLTIMSSATFEECTHKLAKIDIPEGREEELVNMLLECCAQERTFLRYYGLIGSRFCFIADRWKQAFMAAFDQQYNTIHRLETNKLRNVAKLLAHLLHTDALPWSVLSTIHLNEEETTSSSRIFLKILFQEIAEAIGMQKLKERLENPEHSQWFAQLLPRDDNLRNTRYAINFFTSIGLGPLTDSMRAYLKEAPKIMAAKQEKLAAEREYESESDDSSSVSSTSSSSSSSISSSTSSSSYTSNSSSSTGSSSFSSSSSSSYSRRRRRPRRRSPSSRSSSTSSRSDDSRGSRRHVRRRGIFTSEKSGRDREKGEAPTNSGNRKGEVGDGEQEGGSEQPQDKRSGSVNARIEAEGNSIKNDRRRSNDERNSHDDERLDRVMDQGWNDSQRRNRGRSASPDSDGGSRGSRRKSDKQNKGPKESSSTKKTRALTGSDHREDGSALSSDSVDRSESDSRRHSRHTKGRRGKSEKSRSRMGRRSPSSDSFSSNDTGHRQRRGRARNETKEDATEVDRNARSGSVDSFGREKRR